MMLFLKYLNPDTQVWHDFDKTRKDDENAFEYLEGAALDIIDILKVPLKIVNTEDHLKASFYPYPG